MGKVKQAIIDVHEEVADIVQASVRKTPISLPSIPGAGPGDHLLKG